MHSHRIFDLFRWISVDYDLKQILANRRLHIDGEELDALYKSVHLEDFLEVLRVLENINDELMKLPEHLSVLVVGEAVLLNQDEEIIKFLEDLEEELRFLESGKRSKNQLY